MLKELIKLSNYIKNDIKLQYLNNNLNHLIKVASNNPKINESVLVLNDYLIELGAEEKELLDYNNKYQFFHKLVDIFNKYKDDSISLLCEQIYQQIDDIIILSRPILDYSNDNIIMQIQNDILTAIIPEIINFLKLNPIGNLASSLSKILNIETYEERMEFYSKNIDDFNNIQFNNLNEFSENYDIFNDDYKNDIAGGLYFIFLDLIRLNKNYLRDKLYVNLELLHNYYNIDVISIIKDNIPTIKDFALYL